MVLFRKEICQCEKNKLFVVVLTTTHLVKQVQRAEPILVTLTLLMGDPEGDAGRAGLQTGSQ